MAPRTKGERTEAALQDAAREVFASKGFLNAKIADITRAAGRSPGSFYNYYENKEQLLEALIEEFSYEVVEAALAARTGDPLDGIRGAVRAYWTNYQRHLPEIVGMFQMSMTDESFAERWRAKRAAGLRGILVGLRSAQNSGHEIGLDLDVLASALTSMLDGFAWTWLAAGGDKGVETPDDDTVVETLAAVWYRSVYCTTPDDPER